MSGIYMIKNKLDGKVYIGQTYYFHKRIGRHLNELRGNKHPNKHLQSAWNKDGEENFSIIIYHECCIDVLNDCEEYFISYYKSYDRDYGYNKTFGGDVGNVTKETCIKISKAKKGIKLTPEHRAKCSNNMKGKKHTDETKAKMSKAQKGRKLLEEHKQKMSKGSITIVLTEDMINDVKNGLSCKKFRTKYNHYASVWYRCKEKI